MKEKNSPDRKKGILALITVTIFYASAGAVLRYLSYSFGLYQQIYLRTFIGLLLGFIFFRKVDYGKLSKISVKEWLLLTVRTASNVLAATLWVYATPITKLANIAFIDSLPLTAVLSFLFVLEKASWKKVVWVAMSFLGVFVVSVKNLSNLGSFGFGELVVFISGFFFAFRNISRRWQSKLLNDQEISQIMFAIGIVVLFFMSIAVGEKMAFPPMNILLWALLLFGGIIMFANIYLTNYGFASVPAVLGNNILNLEGIFALGIGFLFYGEISTLRELLGGVLIIASVVKMNQIEKEGV